MSEIHTTFMQLEEPTPLPPPDISEIPTAEPEAAASEEEAKAEEAKAEEAEAEEAEAEESPAVASVESLRAATSALERRCGVLERLLDALVGHHRKTYSSIVYLGFSLLALMLAEIVRQSVKMERRLVVW